MKIKSSNTLDGAVFDVRGRMSLAESFFSGGKTYRVIAGNFIKENHRFSPRNDLIFNIFRIIAWVTVIPALSIYFLRSRERSKRNYYILPSSNPTEDKYKTIKDLLSNTRNDKDTALDLRRAKEKIIQNHIDPRFKLPEKIHLEKHKAEIDLAYARIITLNERLKRQFGASLFGSGDPLKKEWFIEHLKTDTTFGLNKMLEEFFSKHSNLSDEELRKHFSHEGIVNLIQHQMYHALYTNISYSGLEYKLPRTFLRIVNSYKIPYPNSSQTHFISKREDIVDIRSKIATFSQKIDRENRKNFNVSFYCQKNPSSKKQGKIYNNHVIQVQRDPRKGFRFFDQNQGISKWLSKDNFAECLKMYMLADHYHICTFN